ncbi:putative transport protein HsrA [Pirellulimonas nuda]|uniref:Putative transport protein HsrA n=1 Tax=Pirellulimonas nuda TaxID=2528009 RepID=A0A518DFW3_9BACT|nr:MFS transporter [Pirellulimonas nuda]QDU90358.1 putative transport protein HsrA [Pirellulimonas nuda]
MSQTKTPVIDQEARASWLPMIVIAMGQMLMSFNVAAIPVSMGGMVESFQTPPTTIGTAVVLYSLGVSGFIMLGAKLSQRFGSKIFFQMAVALFLVAMITIVASPTAEIMLAAQGLAGLAGAALVPTLVVLIADHYRGKQQAEAVGWLGSARAIAGVLAFVIVGSVATWLSWRYAFGLLIVHSAVLLLLSFKLKPSQANPAVGIDLFGVLLSACAVIMITFGFNNLRNWGVLLAGSGAPFDVAGASPAPVMIVVGVVLLAGFFGWSHGRAKRGKTPLLALDVVDSPLEWGTVAALFCIVGIEGAVNFSVPLYIQIVQGQTSLATSMAMMPFMLTVFFTAILIVRLYKRFSPRQIATGAFLLVAVGTAWLAFVIRNDWSVPPVIAGLVLVGLGQGALVTLLFNVLVTASPKELASDVGSLRGVTQNLAAAVGTSLVGAMLVGLLTTVIVGSLNDNPVLTAELKDQANLTNLNFLSDTQLEERLNGFAATGEQLREALRINQEARTRALKTGFLVLSGIALLALVPCRWLPAYRPHEIPSGPAPRRPKRRK